MTDEPTKFTIGPATKTTPTNPPYTGTITITDYRPEGHPLWRRILWHIRHPLQHHPPQLIQSQVRAPNPRLAV